MSACRFLFLTGCAFLLHPFFLSLAQQQGGNLAPPGAPSVTMKSLDKIDPGIALDPAGAPFTLSSPGHYYLTGNVTTVPATAAAITINSSDVTLDLRGFALIASGGTGTADTQSAIYSASSRNLTIRNGHIRGSWFGGVHAVSAANTTCENLRIRGPASYGIRLNQGVHVIDCHVEGGSSAPSGFVSVAGIQFGNGGVADRCTVARCDGNGINAIGAGNSVLDCTVLDNGGVGIDTGASSVVSRCASFRNLSHGIDVFTASSVHNCASFSNNGNGIVAGSGTTIVASAAYDNGGNGFETGTHCSVSDCAAYSNTLAGFFFRFDSTASGCSAGDNDGDGFTVESTCQVRGCVAFSSGLEGFDIISGCVIDGCSSVGNNDNGFSGTAGNVFRNCVAQGNGILIGNAAADGYEFNNGNRFRDCVASGNQGIGMRATATLNDLRDNLIIGNMGGGISLTSTSNLVIGNYAPANTGFNISPAPAPGGDIGPLEDAFSSTNPNANFE